MRASTGGAKTCRFCQKLEESVCIDDVMKMIVRKTILQDKKQFLFCIRDKKQFLLRGLGQKTVYVSENCFLSMCEEKKLFFVTNAK